MTTARPEPRSPPPLRGEQWTRNASAARAGRRRPDGELPSAGECVMAAAPGLPDTRIRPASRKDLPAVIMLRRTVGWGSGGIEGTFAAAASGRLAIFVAEGAGEIVGAVTVSFHAGLPIGRAHVSDLLVAQTWRRRGIGAELLRAAEQEALRRGVRECTLDVDANNEVALSLYVKSGYVHHRPAQFPWGPGHTLKKALGPVAPPPRLGLLARLRWRLRP